MNLDYTDSKLLHFNNTGHNTKNLQITSRLESLSKYNQYYLKFKEFNQSQFLTSYSSLRKKIIFLDIIIATIDTITIFLFCYTVIVFNIVYYVYR